MSIFQHTAQEGASVVAAPNLQTNYLFETTPNVIESVLSLVIRSCRGTVTCPDVRRRECRGLLEPKPAVGCWLRPQPKVSLLLRLMGHTGCEVPPDIGLRLRLGRIPAGRSTPHPCSCLTHHSLNRLLYGLLRLPPLVLLEGACGGRVWRRRREQR